MVGEGKVQVCLRSRCGWSLWESEQVCLVMQPFPFPEVIGHLREEAQLHILSRDRD